MPTKLDVVTYVDPADGELKRKTVPLEYKEFPVKTEQVKIGNGKTVVVQIGPTPGDAYAIFAKNPAFHEDGPETWDRAARTALELWAAKGNRVVARMINEHGRPLNVKLEYSE